MDSLVHQHPTAIFSECAAPRRRRVILGGAVVRHGDAQERGFAERTAGNRLFDAPKERVGAALKGDAQTQVFFSRQGDKLLRFVDLEADWFFNQYVKSGS